MRITVYLARSVVGRSVVVLVLVAVVYVAVDFVETSSLVQVPLSLLARSYPFRLLSIAAFLLPLALMFGVLLSIGASRARGEWEAMSAAGLAPWRGYAALLVVPCLGALLSAAVTTGPGPAALERWQKSLGSTPGEGPAEGWCLHERWIVLDSGDVGSRVGVERTPDGRPVLWSWRRPGKGVHPELWRRGRGWATSGGEVELPGCGDREIAAASGSPLVLPGATLTSTELGEAIDEMRRLGRDPAPLEAEHALRFALAAFCVVLPLVGLGIAGRERRPTRLVGRGILVGALGWLALAAAWNGVAEGVFHPLALSAGVSAVGLVAGGSSLWINSRN